MNNMNLTEADEIFQIPEIGSMLDNVIDTLSEAEQTAQSKTDQIEKAEKFLQEGLNQDVDEEQIFDDMMKQTTEELSLSKDAIGRTVIEDKTDNDYREIKTGLTTQRDLSVLDSLLGQLSDGIWENSPKMDNYWPFLKFDIKNGEVIIKISKEFSNSWGGYNKFRSMSDEQIKEWVARYVKTVVKTEIKDGAPCKWDRNDTTELDYMHDGVTVRDAYRVYDKLKGRKDRILLDVPDDMTASEEMPAHVAEKLATDAFEEIAREEIKTEPSDLRQTVDKLKVDVNDALTKINDPKIKSAIEKMVNWLDGYMDALGESDVIDEAKQHATLTLLRGVIRTLLWFVKLVGLGVLGTGALLGWTGKKLQVVADKLDKPLHDSETVNEDVNAPEIRAKSEELWSKISIPELKQALELMRKNRDAFKVALEFDKDKLEMLGFEQQQYVESEHELKRLENAIFDLAMIAEG